MDFLKALKIDDNTKKHSEASHQPTPPPTAVKGGGGLFDKLTDVIKDELNTKQQPTPVAAPPPPPPAPKHEGLFDKLGDALSGDHKKPVAAPPPAPVHKEESLLNMLGDKLSGHKAPPPLPPAPKSENLLGKLGDKLTGRKTPPPPPREENLLNKLSGVITGKKEEPPKPHGLGDRINSALGGGTGGEAKEGKLDKAIDLFQEHVLKEGPQDHESVFEQAKDKKIADTIRKTIGK